MANLFNHNFNVLKQATAYFMKLMFAKNSTLKKKYNLISAVVQWKILKRAKLTSYPFRIKIDPGNVCNLKCKACPTGVDAPGRSKGMTNWKIYKKVIDEIGDYAFELDLFGWGEPFLSKYIFDMIEYAEKKKIYTIISTNLNVFNDEICENIIKSQLDLLIVSLDGASQESVVTYQVGNDFDRVFDNLKKLVQKKKELKSKKPFIQWRYIVTKFNEHEIPIAQEMAKEIEVDRLELANYRGIMTDEVLADNEKQFKAAEEFLPTDQGYSMYDYSKREKKNLRNDDCIWLWSQTMIHWNGSVSPCCAIWNEKLDFGNIAETSFKEVWNNEKYIAARMLNKKNYKPKIAIVCTTCYKNQAQI